MSAAQAAEADRLVARGDLAGAAQLLEAALGADGGEPLAWLKLAGLRRALRQPHKALAAADRALALAPLDFMALALRAGLLAQLGDAGAGPAWHRALAHRPAGDLPPALAAAVAEGEAISARWAEARAQRLAAALAPARALADDPDAQWRIARFADTLLGRARTYHSEPTDFCFPGLVEREFHPRARFPWLAGLEAAFPAIRAELMALLQSQRASLEPYVRYADHQPMHQWRALNNNPDWSAIHLLNRGERVAANADQCPATMAALAAIDQPRIPGASPNAMFSLLAPRTAIPAHVGVNNARLVCHLPLLVPPGGCWFRVGAETRLWREGEAFVFDDTIEHEADNPTDALRVVLIFDVWHPDLGAADQAAVAAAVASENDAGTLA